MLTEHQGHVLTTFVIAIVLVWAGASFELDGEILAAKRLELVDDEFTHEVRIILGESKAEKKWRKSSASTGKVRKCRLHECPRSQNR